MHLPYFLLLICLRLDIAKNFLTVTNTFNADWITFISTRLIMFLQFILLRQGLTTSRLAAMDAHMLSFEAPAVNILMCCLNFTFKSEFLSLGNYLIF